MKKNGRKTPWGTFAGFCGVAVFYLTVAVAVAFAILDRIQAETQNQATLFDTWWQIVLFVVDILFVVGTAICIVMAVRNKKKSNDMILTEEQAE